MSRDACFFWDVFFQDGKPGTSPRYSSQLSAYVWKSIGRKRCGTKRLRVRRFPAPGEVLGVDVKIDAFGVKSESEDIPNNGIFQFSRMWTFSTQE